VDAGPGARREPFLAETPSRHRREREGLPNLVRRAVVLAVFFR